VRSSATACSRSSCPFTSTSSKHLPVLPPPRWLPSLSLGTSSRVAWWLWQSQCIKILEITTRRLYWPGSQLHSYQCHTCYIIKGRALGVLARGLVDHICEADCSGIHLPTLPKGNDKLGTKKNEWWVLQLGWSGVVFLCLVHDNYPSQSKIYIDRPS
jgi:hypothetical protein